MSFVSFGETVAGIFVRRRNRFVAEVEVTGRQTIAHVPSSGRMTDLLSPGAPLLLRRAPEGTGRSTPYTLLAAKRHDFYVSVDATLPNRLIAACLAVDGLPELPGWSLERPEYALGSSRFDFLLRKGNLECLLEVKSVTHVDDLDGTARFPDAPTVRGTRHLRHLTEYVTSGGTGAVIFVIQRPDARVFAPFAQIDPEFARAFRAAAQAGVTILAYRCKVSPRGVAISDNIPIAI